VNLLRVLIADDHEVVRRGLKDILVDAFPNALFSEAGNGDEVLTHLGGSHFDLLILDINMPGNSGLVVLQDVKHRWPVVPVIIVSVHPEDQYAKRSLRAGAAAYIKKDRAPEELAQIAKMILKSSPTNLSDRHKVSELPYTTLAKRLT
jgi:DNA-binding NarL/FixJ family response regulator